MSSRTNETGTENEPKKRPRLCRTEAAALRRVYSSDSSSLSNMSFKRLILVIKLYSTRKSCN